MEERIVFREVQKLFDKPAILNKIQQVNASSRYRDIEEGNSITLLILGHGRERYRENFENLENLENLDNYSAPFAYVVKQQKTKKTVRILSKAGKPKTCAWDYSLCAKSMSSQDMIIRLSQLFFDEGFKDVNTYVLMAALSSYFKTIYPRIIEKIALNYRDLPEDKDPGSPGAEGYEERFHDFSRVMQSLEESKFSQLKALSHQKVFTIRPESLEIYEEHCERYHMEIVDLRIEREDHDIDFLFRNLPVRENLVQNYYAMGEAALHDYISRFNQIVNDVYELGIDDYEKFYLIKFIYKIYFGQEVLLSEIVEFFTILGIDTINIIDNTCRVKDETDKPSVPTAEIEERERISTLSTLSTFEKGGAKSTFRKSGAKPFCSTFFKSRSGAKATFGKSRKSRKSRKVRKLISA